MAHGFHPLSHSTKEVVLAADFNKTGSRLATGSADHRIRIFEHADDEEDDQWELVEEWRAHNAEVTDLKFHPVPYPPILASISPDIRLKLWTESPHSLPLSGRRWTCIFSQSPPEPTPYSSLAFSPSPSLTPSSPQSVYLALITRSGLLSLLEPSSSPAANAGGASDPDLPSDWREVDSFYVCNGPVARGVETQFKLSFQEAGGVNWNAVAAGVDARSLSLAVSAMEGVKVFRVAPQPGEGEGYRFSPPVAELVAGGVGGGSGSASGGEKEKEKERERERGRGALVRDVAWCGANFGRRDLIASASADGWVRVYEVWVPEETRVGRDGRRGSQRGESFQGQQRGGVLGRRGGGGPSGIGAGLAVGLGGTGAVGGAGEGEGEEGYVPHDWRCVAELRHEGVWKVEWIKGGTMLLSASDTGRAHVWARGKDEKWMEFAEFGADMENDDET